VNNKIFCCVLKSEFVEPIKQELITATDEDSTEGKTICHYPLRKEIMLRALFVRMFVNLQSG